MLKEGDRVMVLGFEDCARPVATFEKIHPYSGKAVVWVHHDGGYDWAYPLPSLAQLPYPKES